MGQNIKSILGNAVSDKQATQWAKQYYNEIISGAKEAAKAQEVLSKSGILSNQMQAWLNNNAKAAERYGLVIKELQSQLNNNKDPEFLRNASLQFRQFQSEAKAAGLVTNSFAKSLKDTVLQVTGLSSGVMVLRKALNEVKEAVDFTKQLDNALTNINYTMDVTQSQLQKIGSSSISMAKELRSSTENVLQAVTLYANAKETADSILAKSKPAVMLANVTGFSGTDSAKYLQTIMNQFDLTQDDLMDISDTIEAVSQNIAHDFSDGIVQINEGIATSGEVARAAGMDLADYASMIGLLVEKTGLAGSQIGNSIKTIITRTTKASEILGIDEGEISDAEESLKAVGIAVRKNDDEFKEFNQTMGELSEKWDTLSDVEKSNIAFSLAGTRQINVIQSLLRNWDEYQSLVSKASNSTGVTFENQEKYADSLSGKMTKLSTVMQSAWHNVINEGEVSTVVGALTKFAETLDTITEKLGLLGTVGLGAGLFAGFKNIGKTYKCTDSNNCFEYALHA